MESICRVKMCYLLFQKHEKNAIMGTKILSPFPPFCSLFYPVKVLFFCFEMLYPLKHGIYSWANGNIMWMPGASYCIQMKIQPTVCWIPPILFYPRHCLIHYLESLDTEVKADLFPLCNSTGPVHGGQMFSKGPVAFVPESGMGKSSLWWATAHWMTASMAL